MRRAQNEIPFRVAASASCPVCWLSRDLYLGSTAAVVFWVDREPQRSCHAAYKDRCLFITKFCERYSQICRKISSSCSAAFVASLSDSVPVLQLSLPPQLLPLRDPSTAALFFLPKAGAQRCAGPSVGLRGIRQVVRCREPIAQRASSRAKARLIFVVFSVRAPSRIALFCRRTTTHCRECGIGCKIEVYALAFLQTLRPMPRSTAITVTCKNIKNCVARFVSYFGLPSNACIRCLDWSGRNAKSNQGASCYEQGHSAQK